METQGAENADGTLYERSTYLSFFTEQAYFTQYFAETEVEFTVETADGKNFIIPDRMRLPSVYGVFLNDIHIAGNSEDGFMVSQ